MNDHPFGPELRRALLEETEPAPGMAERVLAGARPAPSRRRVSWALGALALAMAGLIVATLVLANRAHQHGAVPAATPAPFQPPPAISTRSLTPATFAADGSGWVVEHAQPVPLTGDATVAHTTDGGAHWSSQLDVAAGVEELGTGPGDQALLYVMGLSTGTGTSATRPQSYFYSTADGGAHWQRFPTPAPEQLGGVWMKDAREAWLTAWLFDSGGGPPRQLAIYHTADGARTWRQQATVDVATAFGSEAQGSMAFLDANRGLYLVPSVGGTPSRMYATSDGGGHWLPVPMPGLPGRDAGSAVGTPGLIVLPDGRLALEIGAGTIPPGSGPPAVRRQYLSTSGDAGLHWSEARPLPAASPGALRSVDSTHWWWIARDGRVYASGDAGLSWMLAGSLPRGMTLNDAGFTSAGDGWALASYLRAAVAGNVLLRTADGGRTWRSIVPPHPFQPAVPCGSGDPVTVTAHAHLGVRYNGRAQPSPLPAGLGVTDGCTYRLYTTDASGTIDIATTPSERGHVYTLGNLLDEWGVPDVRYLAPSLGSSVRVTVLVDGKPYGGDPRAIPLRDRTDVVIQATGPTGGA
jgi:photosystem II stability/assembly factor-like uncharacterized protein